VDQVAGLQPAVNGNGSGGTAAGMKGPCLVLVIE